MPNSTVLVIDDSPTIGKLVQLVLTKAGHRVLHAADVESGLATAREEPPSLVLLDAMLGGSQASDAGTVCWALEADPTLGRVPVVLLLTKDDARDFARFANVIDSITKPFAPEALAAVIAHVLERRPPPAAESEDEPLARPTPLPLHPDTPPARSPTAEVPLHAALSGDLSVVSIADVMTLLQDEAQTGTLTLAKHDMRIEIALRLGRIDLALARGVADEFLLGRFLLETKQITTTALDDVIADRARPRDDGAVARPLLGADLVQRGLVVREGLTRAMTLQTSALVFEGLRWGQGRFWFQAAAPADLPETAREAALALGVDAILLEGFRRVDEWRLIEREIGDFDVVFVRRDDKLTAFGRGKLLREELAVLEFVNGKNTVRDIVALTKMGSFDVTKMLYRLLRTKLIRRRVAPVVV